MVSKLLQYIPEHRIYCEVFGGGASLLFTKEPAEVEILLNIKGKVMLSGYAHPIYEPLSHWKRIDFKTACHATGRTRYTKVLGNGSATKICPRVETIWINF